jgi:hypothetical protein
MFTKFHSTKNIDERNRRTHGYICQRKLGMPDKAGQALHSVTSS